MLTSWTIEGIKSFEDEQCLHLAPVTILTGSNSSGKSTLIQSLLVLEQALTSPSSHQTGIQLNGNMVSVGSYGDWSTHHQGADIRMCLTMAGPLDDTLTENTIGRVDESNAVFEGTLELSCKSASDEDVAHLSQVTWISQTHVGGRVIATYRYMAQAVARHDEMDALLGGSLDAPELDTEQPTITRDFPYELSASYDGDSREVKRGGAVALSSLLPARIRTRTTDGFKITTPAEWHAELAAEIETSPEPPRVPVETFVKTLVGSVHHLGPLRDEPRLRYLTESPRSMTDVGKRGQRAIAVMQHFGDHEIMAPDPDDISRTTLQTLAEAVSLWGTYLQILSTVKLSSDKFGTQFRVSVPWSNESTSKGSVHADLTHVGVGVSQMLPMLVMCLAARPGSVVLLEQPELHLHPAVQSRLADFLAACALSGRQIVVETHSEHIINRMRLLVARGTLDPQAHVSLNYIERDHLGSDISRIAIHEDGSLERWPRGFFDETERSLRELMEQRFQR